MPVCFQCHGVSFECIDGHYFCEDCNTQVPYLHEQYSDENVIGNSQAIPSSSKDIADKFFDKGLPWSYHEAFSILLMKQCKVLINNGVNHIFKDVVFNLFRLYLYKQGIAFVSFPTPGKYPRLRDLAMCIQNLDLRTTKLFLNQLHIDTTSKDSMDDETKFCKTNDTVKSIETNKENGPKNAKQTNIPTSPVDDQLDIDLSIEFLQNNYDSVFDKILMEYEINSQSNSAACNSQPLTNDTLTKMEGVEKENPLIDTMMNKLRPKLINKLDTKYYTEFVEYMDPLLVEEALKNKTYKGNKRIKNLISTKRLSLIHNICFIYLGMLYMRYHKIQPSDLIRMIRKQELPYYGNNDNLPAHMKFMLRDNQVLTQKSLPTTRLVRTTCVQLCNVLGNLDDLPLPNLTATISSFIELLHLPNRLRNIAITIYNENRPKEGSDRDAQTVAFVDPPYNKLKPVRYLPNFEGQALAHVYVALKLAYNSHFGQSHNLLKYFTGRSGDTHGISCGSDGTYCFDAWWRSWIRDISSRRHDFCKVFESIPSFRMLDSPTDPSRRCPLCSPNDTITAASCDAEDAFVIPPSGKLVEGIVGNFNVPSITQRSTRKMAGELVRMNRLLACNNSLTTTSVNYVSRRSGFKDRLSDVFGRLSTPRPDNNRGAVHHVNKFHFFPGDPDPPWNRSEVFRSESARLSCHSFKISYRPCYGVGSPFDTQLDSYLLNKSLYDHPRNSNYYSKKLPLKLAYESLYNDFATLAGSGVRDIAKRRPSKYATQYVSSHAYFDFLIEAMAKINQQSAEELLYEICLVEKKLLSPPSV